MTTDPSTQRTRCVLGQPEKPHAAHVGYLCDGHLQGLAADLRQVETLAVELAARPAGTAYRSGAAGGGRGATLASQRSVLNLDRDSLVGRVADDFNGADPAGWDDTPNIADRLGSWADMVREERGLTDAGGYLGADRDLLSRQLAVGWIAEQPWVDEFATEIGELLSALRRAVPGSTRPDEGPCPRLIDDRPCTGRIRRGRGAMPWLVRADRCDLVPLDDVHAGPLECTACGATWPTVADEARLRVMSQDAAREALRPRTEDGQPMHTARELADQRGWTLAATRKRLQRSGARPVHGQWYDARVVDAGQSTAGMVS